MTRSASFEEFRPSDATRLARILRRLLEATLLLAVVLGGSAQGPSLPHVQGRAHIEGVVLDGLTGEPIAAVAVLVQGAPNDQRTDLQGRFSVEVSAGAGTLTLAKFGYRPPRLEGRRLPGNTGIPFDLSPGQRLSGMIVRMFPVSVVSGRVINPRGQAIQAAEVQAFAYLYNDAGIRMRVNAPGNSAKTNDLGEFRLENLDPGEYFIEVRPSSEPGQAEGTHLVPVFYPGVTDVAKAESVSITPGVPVTLKDVTVIAVRSGRLAVRLRNDGDEPRGSVLLSIFRAAETASAFRTAVIPKGSLANSLDLGSLPPGPYFVRATFIDLRGASNQGGALVEVGETDVAATIPIARPVPWTVSGRAVLESGTSDSLPIVGIQLAFYESGAGVPLQRLLPPIVLTSQQDGSFPARSLLPTIPPNLYSLRVLNPPSGLYVSAILGGRGTRELDPDFGRETPFTVVLRDGPGVLEGRLRDAADGEVPFGTVALIPDDDANICRLVTATSSGVGAFRIEAAPGAYHLYAWRETVGAPYLNAEFLQKYKEHAVAVAVEARRITRLELTVAD